MGKAIIRSLSIPTWKSETELVGLVLELEATKTTDLYSQYTIGLHAWFLDQVRQYNPQLSAYLHDGESEKPFNISALEGQLVPAGKQLQLQAHQKYHWYVSALYQPVAEFLRQWLTQIPPKLELNNAPLQINRVSIAYPPTTYKELLLDSGANQKSEVSLSFISPTSFRRKGNHFPLPVPTNLFHSYLRRWNDFSGMTVEQDAFINWIEEGVIIHQHRLESVKVAAGKRGSVTGFVGAMRMGLTKTALTNREFTQLFYTLVKLASYCGTGHKTTFGLGQTRLGWVEPELPTPERLLTNILAERIHKLTEIFTHQRQRSGGDRTDKIAAIWATILARREMGEPLPVIADDLEMPCGTVKTYVKLARRSLKLSLGE
jgi:CRISPR-associated endoribonuclease Cas6